MILLSMNIFSQDTWVQTLTTNGTTYSSFVEHDNYNSLYLVGNFTDYINIDGHTIYAMNDLNTFISKFDEEGEFEWLKPFAKLNYTEGGNIKYLGVDIDNNIIIVGNFSDSLCLIDTVVYTWSGWADQMFALKMNEEGERLWLYVNEDETECACMYENNIIFSGGYHNGLKITSIDANGTELWHIDYSDTLGSVDDISGISCDNSGNVIFTGSFDESFFWNGDTIVCYSSANLLLGSISLLGEINWLTAINSYKSLHDHVSLITDSVDNIYYFLNAYNDCDVFIHNDTIHSLETYAAFLFKFNDSGDLIDHKAIHLERGGYLKSIEAAGKRIWIAGSVSYDSQVYTSDTLLDNVGRFLVGEYSTTDNSLWLTTGGGPISKAIWLNDLTSNRSEDVYLTGNFKGLIYLGDTAVFSSRNAYFLCNFNKQSWTNTFWVPEYQARLKIKLYPNPVDEILYIRMQDARHQILDDLRFEIFDVRGKIHDHGLIDNNALNVSDLSPGIYLLKINSGDHIYTGKFVRK